MGDSAEELPALRGFSQAENKKFESSEPVLGAAGHTNAAFFEDFGKKLAAGKLAPLLKSAPEPSEDKAAGEVQVVVGKTFGSKVLEAQAHVLLEVYAPWCGHCKQLAPVLDELAEHYAENDKVTIAKMDGTTNEAAGLEVKGFPTLRLYASGDGGGANGLEFEGERTLEGLAEFVALHTGESGGGESDAKEEL